MRHSADTCKTSLWILEQETAELTDRDGVRPLAVLQHLEGDCQSSCTLKHRRWQDKLDKDQDKEVTGEGQVLHTVVDTA